MLITLVLWYSLIGSDELYAKTSGQNSIQLIDVRDMNTHNVSSNEKETTFTRNTKNKGKIYDTNKLNNKANEKINNTTEYSENYESNRTYSNPVQDYDSGVIMFQNGLVNIENPDKNYQGVKLDVGNERELLERIVMGEAGGEGFLGQALVAQCIRDALVYKDIDSVQDVITKMKYSGSLDKKPTEEVKQAVSYIFDEGKNAVQHRILYFYAPKIVKSKFHESQNYIYSHKGHKFFDEN